MSKSGYKRRATKWWTKERMIIGLQRFYQDFGFCATSSEVWAKHAQFSGSTVDGRRSNLGRHQRYPSFATILNCWPTFRQAWKAAGFEVGNSNEEWSSIEDWFILESVGVLHRDEVAKALGRSAPAVKRRIYDLGNIRSYNRWGLTLHKAAQLAGVESTVFRKYLDYGIMPYFRGLKLIYINPADLLKVEEINWNSTVDPALETLIRKAVAQRICKMLRFGSSWRDHEVYKLHKTKDRYTGRIKNPRKSALLKDVPPLTSDLQIGDWVRTTEAVKHISTIGDRLGRIESVWYSWQKVIRADGTRNERWVARVEFPKIRTITGEKDRRIRYTIPIDCLERSEAPAVEPKPLSTHPEAVKGRKRIAAGELDRRQERARERYRETIGGEI